MRDGAYAWTLFQDLDDRVRLVETWLVHSLLALKYHAERQMKADELMQLRALKLLTAPIAASYLVAAERPHHRSRLPSV